MPRLRREEVPFLADISVEYYTRLERGEARDVSNDVLETVSPALQLDEAEHAHLLEVAGRLPPAGRPVAESERLTPSLLVALQTATVVMAPRRGGRAPGSGDGSPHPGRRCPWLSERRTDLRHR
ncbi:MAG: helix-turn-helix domain-containing protein [Chloroflexota bacterium]|nr:helix-turn-helix domain-containing protein [Chloroflexota bacterium]